VIVRIWRTGIDMERAAEYDRFVVERSLPMFRRQPGLTTVYFTRTGEEDRAVVTVWADAAAVSALDTSDEYQETTAAIIAAGFLRGPQTVELMPVDQAWPTSTLSRETA
jgi:heme-degrading monooxygenase HmoA